MKLDKKTIFSLLIVILFMGSIFAMIAYTDNSNSGEDYTPITPDNNLELTSYTATFDANVNELFPQIIAAGRPLDFEETSINEKLLDIPGIKNKQIEFRPDADGNINLIITISVVPDKKSEIVTAITAANLFETPEYYQFGLLEIPEKVIFSNDLNQTIEYEFIRPNMEGILGMETTKGDKLSVIAYGTFRGTELINSRAIEQINNSSQYQMLIDFGTFTILEYKNKIYTQANFAIEDLNKTNLEKQIKEKYENTSIEYQITKDLQIDIKDRNIEEIKTKLTALKEEQLFLEFTTDENTASINFDNNVTKEQYFLTENRILEEIETTQDKVLEEIEITAYLEFEYGTIDTIELNNILNNNTEPILFKILTVVDTSNMVIAGKKYNYTENTTEVLLDYPEDLNKTEIELNIQGYYQRDNLLYLGLSK